MKLAPPPSERADAAPDSGVAEQAAADRPAGGGPDPRGSRRVVRGLKALAILFAVTGALVLADAVLTLVWQEPISGLLAHFQQSRLAGDLKRLEAQKATPAQERALAALPSDNARMAFFASALRRSARAGQPVARVRIPRIGADYVVVAGTDEASLKKGPGLYAGTSVPGLPGTVGIAGHRTTYLAPFRRINELGRGDRITLEMPYGLFSYTVLGHRIVRPDDVSVFARAPYDQVVLTACNPLYSAAQRIVVFARLTATAPAGQALATPSAFAARPILGAAASAAAIVGDALPEPGPQGTPPEVGRGEVVLGSPPAGQPSPAVPRARRPARAPRATPIAKTPATAPARPVSTPSASQTPVRTPARVVPRAPARTNAPAPGPTPTKKPATRAPAASSPFPDTSPPAGTAPQTRVQAPPGGVAPIIDVPSG
ncbi:MAG: sortase [Actinobacteria bacterium]|nr:sortase [Actinomycetota bacterium]